MRLAACCGVLAGLAEVLLLGVKRFGMGQFIRFGIDVIWLAPLATTAVFLAAAGVLLLGARRWPRLATVHVAVPVFAFLGLLGVLQMYYPLHVLARILVALGISTQLGRVLARAPALSRQVDGISRRALPWLVAVVAEHHQPFVGIVGIDRPRSVRHRQPLPERDRAPHPELRLVAVGEAGAEA